MTVAAVRRNAFGVACVPIEQVTDLLGHTTTRMIETTYGHRLSAVAAAIELERVLGQS